MSNLPRGFVPLPEIGDFTDKVTFSNLGLPVGFHDERLGINLRNIERIARIASIGEVEVFGQSGRTSDITIGLVGNDNGLATAAGRGSVRKEKMASGSTQGRERYPTAIVKINTSEVAERIRLDDDFRRGVLDPAAQAHYLDLGLKKGLHAAVTNRLLRRENLTVSAWSYAMNELISLGVFHNAPINNLISLAIATPMWVGFDRLAGRNDPPSLFYRVALDRLALSAIAINTSRLIKQV